MELSLWMVLIPSPSFIPFQSSLLDFIALISDIGITLSVYPAKSVALSRDQQSEVQKTVKALIEGGAVGHERLGRGRGNRARAPWRSEAGTRA